MRSKVVRADFGSGLICPRAQICMDSKVVRADFGSGLICPRAQTCCAELRRLARLANSPGFKSFHCPRWRIKFSLELFSDPSRYSLRAQPLESSLGRVPQATRLDLQIKFSKSDRVGRRGLSEHRQDFSRLLTYAWTQIWFVQILAAD